MSVWYCIPSKRPPEEAEPVLREWRERGYKIALQVDGEGDRVEWLLGDGTQTQGFWHRQYRGYAEAVNFLATQALQDKECDWIVTGGDDVLPDPNKTAEEIARECSEYFANAMLKEALALWPSVASVRLAEDYSTFGVMQPTGDRDWGDHRGPYCDFVAGSPWMGREWCLRANQGKGPLWPNFYHMFVDEHLQEMATKLGVFWQRQDLIHKHMNWGRPTKPGQRIVNVEEMPAFLTRANSTEEWYRGKQELIRLRNTGFAECMPL